MKVRVKKLGKATSFYLTEDYITLLQVLGAKEGKTASEIVRELLEERFQDLLKKIRERLKMEIELQDILDGESNEKEVGIDV